MNSNYPRHSLAAALCAALLSPMTARAADALLPEASAVSEPRLESLRILRETRDEAQEKRTDGEEVPAPFNSPAVDLPAMTVTESVRTRNFAQAVEDARFRSDSAKLDWTHGGYYYRKPFGLTDLQLGLWLKFYTGSQIRNSSTPIVAQVDLVKLRF